MHGRRWLIALGLTVLFTAPSRAEVDLSGVYLLRPDHPARYRVTQTGNEIRISSEEAFGTFPQGEVFFEGRIDQAASSAAGSAGKVAGKYKLDGAWVAAVLKFQVGTAYRNFSIAADSGGKLLPFVAVAVSCAIRASTPPGASACSVSIAQAASDSESASSREEIRILQDTASGRYMTRDLTFLHVLTMMVSFAYARSIHPIAWPS